MTTKILITGYYKKDNTGDDIFEKIANKLFVSNSVKRVEYSILPIDILKKNYDTNIKIYENISAIVLFGGETLNEYFLNTLGLIKNHCQHIKLYALGVGLGADPDTLKHYIPMFQYIVVRHKDDLNKINAKFPNVKCKYIQDIAFMYRIKGYQEKPKNYPQKVVGLFLSQPKYNSLKTRRLFQEESELLNSYVAIIKGFVEKGFIVKLFSMCHSSLQSESDTIINNIVFGMLEKKIKQSVKIIAPQNFDNNIITLKYAICERFHSHILSMIYNIPFVSLGNTRKVAHLLMDLGLEKTIYSAVADFDAIYKQLSEVGMHINELKKVYKSIYPSVVDFYEYLGEHLNSFDDVPRIGDFARNKLQLYISEKQATNFCINFLNEFNHRYNQKFVKGTFLSQADYILMKIFGTSQLDYKWGIEEKLRNHTFNIADVKWLFEQSLINHSFLFNKFSSSLVLNFGGALTPTTPTKKKHELLSIKEKEIEKEKERERAKSLEKGQRTGMNENNNHNKPQLFNIDYIDQYDRTGVHRHGWKYVIDNFSNELCSYDDNLIKCDLYVDRTFHWERENMIEAGVIPYKTAWIGFIHHTLYQDESGHNCVRLLHCPEFIESLRVCKCLIVLSNYLKNNLLKMAAINGVQLPVIHTIYHPTYFITDETKLWKYGKWKLDSWKGEVIQVGSWMRDIKAIFDLAYTPKFALIGKKMEDKYKAISFGDDSVNLETVENNLEYPVKIINFLENEDYDEILTRYVVFLKLKDASAVNTIIECIIRNTPIVVNKLPAVEEYLGPNYPLYYKDLDDVPRILKNKRLIVKANTYLKNMNKDFLKIENFLKSMRNLYLHQPKH